MKFIEITHGVSEYGDTKDEMLKSLQKITIAVDSIRTIESADIRSSGKSSITVPVTKLRVYLGTGNITYFAIETYEQIQQALGLVNIAKVVETGSEEKLPGFYFTIEGENGKEHRPVRGGIPNLYPRIKDVDAQVTKFVNSYYKVEETETVTIRVKDDAGNTLKIMEVGLGSTFW